MLLSKKPCQIFSGSMCLPAPTQHILPVVAATFPRSSTPHCGGWALHGSTPLLRSLPWVKAALLSTALLPVEMWDFWSRYSSYTALVQVLSWLRRFTSEKLASSRKLLILQQQRQSFPEVFQWLKKEKSIPGAHCLAGMVIYLDKTTKDVTSNIIKVTGRVRAEASSKSRELTPF